MEPTTKKVNAQPIYKSEQNHPSLIDFREILQTIRRLCIPNKGVLDFKPYTKQPNR